MVLLQALPEGDTTYTHLYPILMPLDTRLLTNEYNQSMLKTRPLQSS
jgi:hypothetical protein